MPNKQDLENLIELQAMVISSLQGKIKALRNNRPLQEKPINCPDCNAVPGNCHKIGCDVERCSVCGGQYISCGCKTHDQVFSRWTGIWPGKAESELLGVDLNEFYSKGLYKSFFIKPT